MSPEKPEGKIIRIDLHPCMGSTTNPHDHIYVVDEIYDSGKIDGVDFMGVLQAVERYGAKGISVLVSQSHNICADCFAEPRDMTREEVIKKYYPNYRGD
ncbi:hypothetical protein HOD75_02180 [archaeon]|jgi:hypothetical protein|nr:hypothetical protein [archaeon]MBT4241685.1 hypothetical protein [archaeon]MBT4418080.1 hypothetical protein [archaeon]